MHCALNLTFGVFRCRHHKYVGIATDYSRRNRYICRCLSPSQIGEHASTVAREAIVQAEIIYISHR